MTTKPSRWRRLKEWFWRGELLKQLEQRRWTEAQHQAVEEARSCHTLAWRTVAGLEPVPAMTRDAVARPLLLTGLAKCVPLADPAHATVAELFDDPIWQERLVKAGVAADAQPAIRDWLLERGAPTNQGAGRQALAVLAALLENLQAARAAIRRLFWRRVRVLGVSLLLLLGLVASVALLLSPPEGPDLGAGKPWVASSNYPGFPGSGRKPVKPPEVAFFSTNDDVSPWWKIDLQAPTAIGSVTIVNRTDCCPDRAVPLVVEVSLDGEIWREVARRTETFRTWAPSFKATKARFVRLRALRRTFVHFKDVRIHAPATK